LNDYNSYLDKDTRILVMKVVKDEIAYFCVDNGGLRRRARYGFACCTQSLVNIPSFRLII
jgi:hypothetical protein